MIRTAIIGTGNAARMHADAIAAGGGPLALAAVAGRDRSAAEKLAAARGRDVRVMSADEAVRSPDIDAVILALPASVQPALAVAAFNAGKHVLCEKPLAPSLKEAEGVRDAWKSAGTVGMVNFCYRFIPEIAEFRRALETGECGELSWIAVEWAVPSRLDPALPFSWKSDASMGGGALRNFASHIFDYLLRGRDVAVAAAWQRKLTPMRGDRKGVARDATGDEVLTVTFDAAGWCPVVVHVSLVTQPALGHRLTARGTKRTITTTVHPTPEYLSTLFETMAARFASAISGSGASRPDLDDGVAAARLVDLVAARAQVQV